MSSFNQGTPSANTLINSSSTLLYGNTTSGTALTVQQLGAGAVMNVATSTGSSALFVSSTGQVGVGTTSPANGFFGSGLIVNSGTINGSNAFNMVLLSNATTVNYTQVGQIGFGIGGDMPSFSIQSQAVNRDNGAGPYYDYGAQSDLRFLYKTLNTWPGGGVNEAMRIKGTNGNVGIGTTNPGYILEVSNSTASTSTSFLGLTNPYVFGFNTGLNIGSSIVYSSRWQGDGLSGVVEMCKIDGRKENNANYGDSYLAFQTRYETNRGTGGPGTLTEKMRIASTGNVGIGTTSPIAQLHAYQSNGTGYQLSINNVANAGGSNYSAFIHSDQAFCGAPGGVGQYTYSGASLLVTSYPNNTANNSGYTAYFGTSANDASSLAPQMVIKAATGNVGIGTASPGAALQVNGTGPIFNGSGSAGPVTKYYNFSGNIPVNSTPAIVFNFSNFSFYVKIIAMQGDLNNSNNVNILTIEAIGGNFYGSTPSVNVTQLSKVQGGSGPAWSGTVTYGVQSITITPGTSTGGSIWNTRVELVSMAATGAGYVASLSNITQGGATVYTPGY